MAGFDPITAALNIGGKVIDKIFPDPAEREAAKLAMFKAQQDGTFREIEVQMGAILAEAQSADPWTSRARPSFLYVMYAMILAAIPMGVLSAFKPELAVAIANGMKAWLAAIPEPLWAVFGVGYMGYVGAREYGKTVLAKKQ